MHQLPPDPFDAAAPRRPAESVRPRSKRAAAVAVLTLVATLLLAVTLVLLWMDRGSAPTLVLPTVPERAAIDPARPFLNTPAITWAEGEAGIVVAPATPVGRYPAEQVAAVMERVRQVIVAARLNRHVLESHDAEPVLALLSAQAATGARELIRPGNEAETWWVSAKIAEGYSLLPATPRVIGTMTARVGPDGELVISTNYLVAYAFEAWNVTQLDDPLDIVAVDRWEVDYEWVEDSRYAEESQGLHLGATRGFTFGANCAMVRAGFLAPGYSDTGLATGPSSQPVEAYFDPNAPLDEHSNC
ncbi:hypothetical protein [Nocardia sp. NPDC051833]|uniref:hypothetical protein n=1 Tax=Nocardia sp. NPDC051833 TaxID=3155674 RepID=UPI0034154A04